MNLATAIMEVGLRGGREAEGGGGGAMALGGEG